MGELALYVKNGESVWVILFALSIGLFFYP